MSRYFIKALILSLVLLSYPAVAQDKQDDAQQNLLVGRGLICDTEQLAERYVALFDGDTDHTVGAVNAEAGKADACMVATVAFLPAGADSAKARNARDDSFRILPIVVVGVPTETGIQQVLPIPQFALVKVDEIGI